jgi:hypothetical protein
MLPSGAGPDTSVEPAPTVPGASDDREEIVAGDRVLLVVDPLRGGGGRQHAARAAGFKVLAPGRQAASACPRVRPTPCCSTSTPRGRSTLKQEPRTRHCPVVAIGEADSADALRCGARRVERRATARGD